MPFIMSPIDSTASFRFCASAVILISCSFDICIHSMHQRPHAILANSTRLSRKAAHPLQSLLQAQVYTIGCCELHMQCKATVDTQRRLCRAYSMHCKNMHVVLQMQWRAGQQICKDAEMAVHRYTVTQTIVWGLPALLAAAALCREPEACPAAKCHAALAHHAQPKPAPLPACLTLQPLLQTPR